MPTTITGTDGVSQVQNGAVESGDLAAGAIGSGDLPAGSVIQVVHTVTNFELALTSTTFVDTGYSISITPKSANSKILVTLAGGRIRTNGTTSTAVTKLIIKRNGTAAIDSTNNVMRVGTLASDELPISYSALDNSHGATSATTYNVFALSEDGTSVNINNGSVECFSITAMEIAG